MSFNFGTKAETLERIKPVVTLATILDLYYFTVEDWQTDRKKIIRHIKEQFTVSELAVRSSAQGEDSDEYSMAGVFIMCRDVVSNDDEAINNAVEKVIKSFSGNPKDQVLIQPMLSDVSVSGVIMTHDVEHGAPYYIINFDDESGKTDSVTGGSGVHKAVLVYKKADHGLIKSPRVRRFVELAVELEEICGNAPLDIEFTMSSDGTLYLFQLRRISLRRNWHPVTERRVARQLCFIEEFIQERFKPRPGIFGHRTILAVMPDWNPAEIIGLTPRPLAASLYRELITRSIWHEARTAMGYRRLPPEELMVIILGHPYIDVRNSFNSFLPPYIDDNLAEILVNAWIDRLDEHPQFHDKVEFEVVHTCYDFAFDENFKDRYSGLLSRSQYLQYKKQLQNLTYKCVNVSESGLLNTLLAATQKLEKLQKEEGRKNIRDSSDGIDALIIASYLIEDCKKLGTLPFAVIARNAFIAEALLRSAIDKGAIDGERVADFKKSIRTITGDLINDYIAASRSEILQEAFLEKYGHLRPGTYDITSLRYDERDDLFSETVIIPGAKSPINFKLSSDEMKNLDCLLLEHGFIDIDANDFLEYCRLGIAGREYSKFVFTRNLSDALENMVRWSESVGLSRDDLSYLHWPALHDVLMNCISDYKDRHFLEMVERSRRFMEEAQPIKLSYMIRCSDDIYITTLHRSEPNFIGKEKAEGFVMELDAQTPATINLFENIVCVENADPGFDWIFTKGIKALITKFGGSNSHMAIRCAELGIPAVIGCGEQTYDRIISAGTVQLNCEEKSLRPIYAP